MNKRLFPPIINTRIIPTRTNPLALDFTCHVFDGGGGYYTTEHGQPKIAPEGGVMYSVEDDDWYIMRSGQWHRIKREDIPAEVRTTMLLLSISL